MLFRATAKRRFPTFACPEDGQSLFSLRDTGGEDADGCDRQNVSKESTQRRRCTGMSRYSIALSRRERVGVRGCVIEVHAGSVREKSDRVVRFLRRKMCGQGLRHAFVLAKRYATRSKSDSSGPSP